MVQKRLLKSIFLPLEGWLKLLVGLLAQARAPPAQPTQLGMGALCNFVLPSMATIIIEMNRTSMKRLETMIRACLESRFSAKNSFIGVVKSKSLSSEQTTSAFWAPQAVKEFEIIIIIIIATTTTLAMNVIRFL